MQIYLIVNEVSVVKYAEAVQKSFEPLLLVKSEEQKQLPSPKKDAEAKKPDVKTLPLSAAEVVKGTQAKVSEEQKKTAISLPSVGPANQEKCVGGVQPKVQAEQSEDIVRTQPKLQAEHSKDVGSTQPKEVPKALVEPPETKLLEKAFDITMIHQMTQQKIDEVISKIASESAKIMTSPKQGSPVATAATAIKPQVAEVSSPSADIPTGSPTGVIQGVPKTVRSELKEKKEHEATNAQKEVKPEVVQATKGVPEVKINVTNNKTTPTAVSPGTLVFGESTASKVSAGGSTASGAAKNKESRPAQVKANVVTPKTSKPQAPAPKTTQAPKSSEKASPVSIKTSECATTPPAQKTAGNLTDTKFSSKSTAPPAKPLSDAVAKVGTTPSAPIPVAVPAISSAAEVKPGSPVKSPPQATKPKAAAAASAKPAGSKPKPVTPVAGSAKTNPSLSLIHI